LLAEVASFAVRAIPGADGAGVTLLRLDRLDNMVEELAASSPFVAEIDHVQYVVLNEGPCITAALERRTVRSGSLGGEKMWPRFGPRVGRMGVHSALSLPLLLPGQVIDQAIGLLRGRSGGSAEEAFAQLRAMSQSEHRKLADVAKRIVDEAVRRARARHHPH
jgi:hypothetical protein